MPVRRAKACVQCRKAKSRCSLSTPCSRCAIRRLDCHYVRALPHLENRSRATFRPIRPATDFFTPNHSVSADDIPANHGGVLSSADRESSVPVGKEEEPKSKRCYANFDENELSGTIQGGTEYGNPGPPPCSDFSSHIFDIPESFDMPFAITPAASHDPHDPQVPEDTLADPPYFDMISPRLLNLDLPFDIPAFPTPHPTESTPSIKTTGPQLAQRPRSLQQGSLTAKMVFSRMKDYSRMMADAKTLPPFIFPPCCLGPDDECPPNEPHRCLPEALAVCSNLTHMFYNRMPGSHNFVWKQICAHIREMREEYEKYDETSKLTALQSALVYGMLCAQCTESMPVEDSTWIVSTIEDFAEELYDLGTWGLDTDSLCVNRTKWVFVETLRRIGSLLCLFDLLLQIDTQTPSTGDCPEFFDMPLPCHRDLWEPIPDRDWRKRHQEDIESKKQNGRQGLTLGKLLLHRQCAAHGEDPTASERPGFAEELAEWCEKVDDLSMLLWMAITVEGEGQSQLYRLGISPTVSI